MGLEPLQGPAHLAGQFLGIDLLALNRGQALEFGLCLGQPDLSSFLVALLPPRSAGNHITFVSSHYLHQLCAVPQFG